MSVRRAAEKQCLKPHSLSTKKWKMRDDRIFPRQRDDNCCSAIFVFSNSAKKFFPYDET